MRIRWLSTYLLIALFLGWIFGHPSGAAFAQGTYQVVINYPEVSEGPGSMTLGLYFTILDNTGQIVTDAEIESVSILQGDGTIYGTSFGKPQSDAFVVLVLDTSGSMALAMPQTLQAAIQAIGNAPEEAAFAVIQFNNNISLVQDFSKDREQIAEEIETLAAVPGSGTCLYDAAYRALELTKGAPRGRRAVILLTDGRDEMTAGVPCSQHTYEDVLSLATRQDSWVPVHTIGLSTTASSALNEALLRDLSTSTGGFAEFGEQGSLSLLFTKIVNSLSHQWLAQANVYPDEGENSFSLLVTLPGGIQIQSEPVTITSSRDFDPPPLAAVNTLDYTNQGDLILGLDLTNESELERFEIQVYDIKNNTLAPPFTEEVTDELEIDASNFESGNEYRLIIRGTDAIGNLLLQTLYEFRYDPAIVEPVLSIPSVELDMEVPEFIINVRSQYLEEATAYEVWLIDEEGNTVVPGSRQTTEPTTVVHIPLDDVSNGSYSIALSAVNAEGQVLAETLYEKALYHVGFIARVVGFINDNIVIPLFFLVLFIGSAAFLVKKYYLDPRKEKRTSVLLEVTALGTEGSLESVDDWSDDAVRLHKKEMREQVRRSQRDGEAEPQPTEFDTQLEISERLESEEPVSERITPPQSLELPYCTLVVEESPEMSEDGPSFTVDKVPYTIGRVGADLELDFPTISRNHAEINFEDDTFLLRDDNSANGTTVDGENITGQGDIELESGALIGLGKSIQLRFVIGGS